MRIAEIYESIQGEGFLTGTPSIFVRVSGCNLRCWYCDTPYASWHPEGEDLSIVEISEKAADYQAEHCVLTGGEPMLFAEIIPLCQALRDRQLHVTIETAGTLYLPVACDLMSISPKLSNSTPHEGVSQRWRERHERTRHAPDVIRRLMAEHPYQFKFVIDKRADCEEVERYLESIPELDSSRVLMMPQGTDRATLAATAAWLEPWCRERRWHYCPRRHIELFGLARGT